MMEAAAKGTGERGLGSVLKASNGVWAFAYKAT